MSADLVSCPFCGEEDYDLIGLKMHFAMNCDVFDEVAVPRKKRPKARPKKGPWLDRNSHGQLPGDI